MSVRAVGVQAHAAGLAHVAQSRRSRGHAAVLLLPDMSTADVQRVRSGISPAADAGRVAAGLVALADWWAGASTAGGHGMHEVEDDVTVVVLALVPDLIVADGTRDCQWDLLVDAAVHLHGLRMHALRGTTPKYLDADPGPVQVDVAGGPVTDQQGRPSVQDALAAETAQAEAEVRERAGLLAALAVGTANGVA